MSRTICPLYTPSVDPLWDARLALLRNADIAIVNSGNNGPFPYDPILKQRIKELENRGIIVFGYVHTAQTPETRGDRPWGEIFKEITAWRKYYGVRRPFLDEWPTDHNEEIGLMWGAVRGYAGSGTPSLPIVIFNPGTYINVNTVPPGALVVTHEGTQLPTAYSPKPWEAVILRNRQAPYADLSVLNQQGWQWTYSTSDGEDGNAFDEVGA